MVVRSSTLSLLLSSLPLLLLSTHNNRFFCLLLVLLQIIRLALLANNSKSGGKLALLRSLVYWNGERRTWPLIHRVPQDVAQDETICEANMHRNVKVVVHHHATREGSTRHAHTVPFRATLTDTTMAMTDELFLLPASQTIDTITTTTATTTTTLLDHNHHSTREEQQSWRRRWGAKLPPQLSPPPRRFSIMFVSLLCWQGWRLWQSARAMTRDIAPSIRATNARETSRQPPPPQQQQPPQAVTANQSVSPLCPLCLEIIQQAPLISLEFVDVVVVVNNNNINNNNSNQTPLLLPAHPHMGALNVQGRPGYRQDATALRRHPPDGDSPLQSLRRRSHLCRIQDATYTMIQRKIRVVTAQQLQQQRQRRRQRRRQQRHEQHPMLPPSEKNDNDAAANDDDDADAPVKLLCIVYTTAQNTSHPRRTTTTTTTGHDRIQRIRETWGSHCDGFFAASTRTDPAVDAVHIPHAGPETYDNIWQKVRSIWSYVYDHYYHDYDWFHIGGDDLYLIVNNLRYYLESDEIQWAAQGGRRRRPLSHASTNVTGTTPPPPTNTTTSSSVQRPLFLGKRQKRVGNASDIYNDGGPGKMR